LAMSGTYAIYSKFHSPADIITVMEIRMTGLGHLARMEEMRNANQNVVSKASK
jgi:hypothetical protein